MGRSFYSGPVASANGFAAFQENTTNLSLQLSSMGTGVVAITTNIPVFFTSPVTLDTTSDVTYTAAQLKGGIILRDPNGGARADLFPTAAALVAAFPSCPVGTTFEIVIRNTADAAETITMTTNTGLTLSGTMTIAQNNQRRFWVRLTNVTSASEAATIYSIGGATF
jgi:hypothetical protein